MSTNTDDWKDDDLKRMEDQMEEDLLRCTSCGEPYQASEAHECDNDEGTPGFAERRRIEEEAEDGRY